MVLTSPLPRAARTCALAGFATTAEVDRGLLEWNYGQYEGRRTAEKLYVDADVRARKAILHVAASGKFSSDRAIAEYAHEIWEVKPCPVP
jgi:glucan phosphorylase